MSRKDAVKYEEVAAKAQELLDKGIKPTVRNVHAALGKRGSFSTINPHLKRWQAERQIAVQQEGEFDTGIVRSVHAYTQMRENRVKAVKDEEIDWLTESNDQMIEELGKKDEELCAMKAELEMAMAQTEKARAEQLKAVGLAERLEKELTAANERLIQVKMEVVRANTRLEEVPRLECLVKEFQRTQEELMLRQHDAELRAVEAQARAAAAERRAEEEKIRGGVLWTQLEALIGKVSI